MPNEVIVPVRRGDIGIVRWFQFNLQDNKIISGNYPIAEHMFTVGLVSIVKVADHPDAPIIPYIYSDPRHPRLVRYKAIRSPGEYNHNVWEEWKVDPRNRSQFTIQDDYTIAKGDKTEYSMLCLLT